MTQQPFDGLGATPMSSDLLETLARANAYARAQSHATVTLEHVLLALSEDQDAVQLLATTNVDIDALKADVSGHISRDENRHGDGPAPKLSISAEVTEIMKAASAAASGRRPQINGAIVLAAIVGDGRSTAAQILRVHGLTFDHAITFLRGDPPASAPTAQQPTSASEPPSATETAQENADDFMADARSRVQSRTGQSSNPQQARIEGAAEDGVESPAEDQSAPPAPEPQPPAEDGQAAAPSKPEPVSETAPPVAAPVPASQAPAPKQAVQNLPPLKDVIANQQAQHPAQQTTAPHQQPPQSTTPGAQPVTPGAVRSPAPQPQGQPVQQRPAGHPQPAGPAGSRPPQQGVGAPGHAQARGPGLSQLQVDAQQQPGPPASRPQHPQQPGVQAGGQPPHPHGAPLRQPPPGQQQQAPHLQAPVQARRPTAPPRQPTANRASVPAAAQTVEAGQLVENIPRKMKVGTAMLVEARISKADVRAVTESFSGGGPTQRHEILVTKAMSVRLRAPSHGFTIETSSPETQWIENNLGALGDDYASWRWTITPKTRGVQQLQMIVSARTVGSDGLTAETVLPDQIINVKVKANYARALKRWSVWVFIAIVGGLLARFGETFFEIGKSIFEKIMAG